MTRKQLIDATDETIGQEIRTLRLELGLTQRQLARRLTTSPSFVSDIEAGYRKANPDVLYRLAVIFRVTVKRFTSLVEPCPHCSGTGVLHKSDSRSGTLRQALFRSRT